MTQPKFVSMVSHNNRIIILREDGLVIQLEPVGNIGLPFTIADLRKMDNDKKD